MTQTSPLSTLQSNSSAAASNRIVGLVLECQSLSTGTTEIEIERRRALADILDYSAFAIMGFTGPYSLSLALTDGDLAINANCLGAAQTHSLSVALGELQQLLMDYAALCDSFYKAARTGQIARLDSIDSVRRGLHDAAADMIMNKLQDKVVMDKHTALRLFTLLYVLHIKNS